MTDNQESGAGGKKLFFIVNPLAKNGKGERLWRKLLPLLHQEKLDFNWAYTEEAGSASRQVRAALDSGHKLIVAMGGDGTAHEAANGMLQEDRLYKEDSALAVWPIGSGCDLARMLYKKRGDKALLELLRRGKVTAIDAARCAYTSLNGEKSTYYINSADIGLGALTCRRVNLKKRKLFSRLAYLAAAIHCLLNYKYVETVIETDVGVFRGGFLLAAVCNGRYFGGGMMPAPAASLNDGLLDLLLVRKMSKLKVLRVLPGIYRGRHLDTEGVEYYQVKEVKIATETAMSLETDGETIGYSDLSIEVLPAALPMLLPEDFVVRAPVFSLCKQGETA